MGFLMHLLLFLTISSFPLYLLPSGGIQLSHGFFVLFFVIFYFKHSRQFFRLGRNVNGIAFALLSFVTLSSFVQIIWSSIHGQYEVLLFSVFYVFNSLYFLTIYVYLTVYREKGLNLIFLSTVMSIVLVFGGLLAGVSTSAYRKTSFFNNPNQLGYFALIATIIILLLYTRCKLRFARVISLGALLINLYLSSVSLSKAALISTAISIICFLPMFKKSELAILATLILASFPIWLPRVTGSDVYAKLANRIERIGMDRDDSILGRGYGRIGRYPEQIILGAGEGNVGRWDEKNEVHSMFGNTLFCYGILGFSIFSYFIILLFKRSPLVFTVLFAPVFAYGLTHNGIRFSSLWLLFGLYLFIVQNHNKGISSARKDLRYQFLESAGVQLQANNRSNQNVSF